MKLHTDRTRMFMLITSTIVLFSTLTRAAPLLDEDVDAATHDSDIAARSLQWQDTAGKLRLETMVGAYSNADNAPVAQFIRQAKRSVDIEIYEMSDPEVQAALREVMKQPKKVLIRVIEEPSPVGQRCDVWANTPSKKPSCAEEQRLRSDIINSGGRYVPFNKAQLCGTKKPGDQGSCFEHGKMILIDGDFALLSTGNFNSSNLCDRFAHPSICNRDYTYVTRDRSVVRALNAIFENDLIGKSHDPRVALAEAGASEKLTVSPYSYEPLVKFIESAKSSIQLQNQYINPNSRLSDVLVAMAKKGVKIEVQLSDICYYSKPKENEGLVQKRLMFQEMESAGVSVRMFPKAHHIAGHSGYLHAKAIVVDGAKAWIGSVNGSSTSLNRNREFGIFFHHQKRVSSLSRFMKSDFDDQSSQTWKESFACHRAAHQ